MGTPSPFHFCPKGGIYEQTLNQVNYSVGSEHWLSVLHREKNCYHLPRLHSPFCVLWQLPTSTSVLSKQSSFQTNTLLWRKISVFIQRSAIFIHQWKYNVRVHTSLPVKGSQARLNLSVRGKRYLPYPNYFWNLHTSPSTSSVCMISQIKSIN